MFDILRYGLLDQGGCVRIRYHSIPQQRADESDLEGGVAGTEEEEIERWRNQDHER